MKIEKVDYPFNGFEESLQSLHADGDDFSDIFPMIENERGLELSKYYMILLRKETGEDSDDVTKAKLHIVNSLKIMASCVHSYELLYLIFISFSSFGGMMEERKSPSINSALDKLKTLKELTNLLAKLKQA